MRKSLIWIGVFAPILHVILGGETRTDLMFNIVPTVGLILVFLSGESKMAAMVYLLAGLTALKASLLPLYMWSGYVPASLICYTLAVCYGFIAYVKSTSRLPRR